MFPILLPSNIGYTCGVFIGEESEFKPKLELNFNRYGEEKGQGNTKVRSFVNTLVQQKYAPLFSTLSMHMLNDVFKVDYSGSKQGSLAPPCGHSNVPSAPTKCKKLHFLSA